MKEGDGLWSKILKVRYGLGIREVTCFDSTWWRDLGKLDGGNTLKEGRLVRGMARKLGKGGILSFGMTFGWGEKDL